jgi:hypothetical protein
LFQVDLQTSCNMVEHCQVDIRMFSTACSQLLQQVWNKLLSPFCKFNDGNRPPTSCSNKTARKKLLRVRCHQLVNNLLRADDFWLDGTACAYLLALSTLLQDDNNLFQTCQQLGTSSADTLLLINRAIFTRVREAANISSAYSFESECFIVVLKLTGPKNHGNMYRTCLRRGNKLFYSKKLTILQKS